MSFIIEVNQNIIEMEYAVRGPIPLRAAALQAAGRVTIPCNIGNPQALGQQPISLYRQVLALLEDSGLRQEGAVQAAAAGATAELEAGMAAYARQVADEILEGFVVGLGAYTDSKGPAFIRQAVADFIDERDGGADVVARRANPEHIFLTNGASQGAKNVLELLIAGPNDGIMIPIPQYPLYSATIRRFGGVQVNYYPDEEAGWSLSRAALDEALAEARRNGVRVKALVVINPGNPTGAILDRASIEEVINFAEENEIAIIADEVYQENLYGAEFCSFAQVLGSREVPLFSLHSVSKGFIGECGQRGGYLEVRNAPELPGGEMPFVDLLRKQVSVNLCSGTVGQTLTYLMVRPPAQGTAGYEPYQQERQCILDGLFEKATMIREALSEMEGVEVFGRTGAMYLFPRLTLPAGTNDFDYCMSLLEQTGLCTVNGAGFGQREGTHHLRIAFLPPKEMLEQVLPQWREFHQSFLRGA
jgi:aspartate/methionine/tyrosine aminotransferase